jgi:hypothetical protein
MNRSCTPWNVVWHGLDLDPASLRPHDPLGNGQPQATTFLLVRGRDFAAIKPVEYPRQAVGGNPFAGIGGGDFDAVRLRVQ